MFFRTVPSAHTLVRWVNENAFAPIVRARPCPTFGRPVHHRGGSPLITARYFSAYPSDSTSRWTPCPPESCWERLQVHLGCFRLSLSCPFRLLHTFSPSRLRDPLHRRLQQICCLLCCSDCYRVERSSSRVGLAPTVVQRLSRRTVKNGSKIRGTLCRAIPLPLSATVIRSVRALCYLNKWHPLISTRVTEIMNTTRL